jgi:hypothetical protein
MISNFTSMPAGCVNHNRDRQVSGPIKKPRLVDPSMPFEILHGSLMLLGRGQCRKGSQIPALAGFRVNLSRIKTVLSGRQLANHDLLLQKRRFH